MKNLASTLPNAFFSNRSAGAAWLLHILSLQTPYNFHLQPENCDKRADFQFEKAIPLHVLRPGFGPATNRHITSEKFRIGERRTYVLYIHTQSFEQMYYIYIIHIYRKIKIHRSMIVNHAARVVNKRTYDVSGCALRNA